MAITNIADQLTPGRPTEITFAGETGLPSATNNLVLIGHLGAAAATGTVLYQPININNVASLSAASGEVAGYFGDGSELALMVIAAVKANQLGGNFPPITAIPLAIGDTDWGQALAALDRIPGSVIAGCYDGQTQQLLAQALISEAAAMSTAARVQNAQYGSVAVLANRSVVSGANLFAYDSQFGAFVWQRDTGTGAQANAQSIGELAASVGAQLAANQVPFNPLNNNILPNVPTPAKMADWITVGAGMESETALVQGWIPLRVLPNGTVAIVRARNLRTTVGDGVTKINSYYDVPDFQVLYFWRKTLVTRFNQPDLTNVKASAGTEQIILSEVIRLAQTFQDQGMFQNVTALAKLFIVERNISDRTRFDVFTPVNVIPGLMVVATNIQATTLGDNITV